MKILLDNLPDGIDPALAAEFIKHRTAIKAPLTQFAFDLNMKAAVKAAELGFSANEAIEETIMNGWRRINGEWLAKLRPVGGKPTLRVI